MTEVIQERKKGLIADLNAQKVFIERMEAEMAAAQVTLNRMEGAILLCDELLKLQTPAQGEPKKNWENAGG